MGVGGGPDCAQYLPPVFTTPENPVPPQTIISLPVQTAVCDSRPEGAASSVVGVQLFVSGLYLPPVLVSLDG